MQLPDRANTKTFRLKLPSGWRLKVVYRPSPFVEMWGYRPLAMGVGFLATLCAIRLTL